MTTTWDEFLQLARDMTLADVLLMTEHSHFFEHHAHLMEALEGLSHFDYQVALAVTFGWFCAGIEGEPVEAEAKHGLIIGFEQRMQLFTEIARKAFEEAYKLRSTPGCPVPPVKGH
jgi:hypothetical protein